MIIKNILDKIYFHPLFYIILSISLITGHFRNIIYFTLIIFIHELGHSITGLIFGCRLNKIEIYLYGGCSRLEHDINIKLIKELLILIMGPIAQILFTYLVYYFKLDVSTYFYQYSKYILIFNLLPIYPLDGGKLLNIFLSYFISYYNSLKYTYYLSYLFYITILITIILMKQKNLFIILILISLGIDLIKEIKNRFYLFRKFLLERLLNNYNFKKIKRVLSIKKIKRDYYHIIGNISEKEYLRKYFV